MATTVYTHTSCLLREEWAKVILLVKCYQFNLNVYENRKKRQQFFALWNKGRCDIIRVFCLALNRKTIRHLLAANRFNKAVKGIPTGVNDIFDTIKTWFDGHFHPSIANTFECYQFHCHYVQYTIYSQKISGHIESRNQSKIGRNDFWVKNYLETQYENIIFNTQIIMR